MKKKYICLQTFLRPFGYKENTLVVDIDIDNTARPHITNSATVCRIQTKLPLNEA